jgi:hypothetical protein
LPQSRVNSFVIPFTISAAKDGNPRFSFCRAVMVLPSSR